MTEAPPHLDYDPFIVPTQEALRSEWEDRRERCPVSHSDTLGGFTYLTRFEDVANALSDTVTFSSSRGAGIPPQPFKMLPEDLDPPESRAYRHLINPRLAPQVVAKHEQWIRDICVELLDDLKDRTDIDAVEDYSKILPQRVTIRLVGIPDDALDLVDRTTWLLTIKPRGNAEADAAGTELFTYLGQLIATRRNEPVGDDFIGDLMSAEIDGQPLDDGQILSFVALLLFGGLHTTAGAIGGALLYLAEHQDRIGEFVEALGKDDKVLNEVLRYNGPSCYLGRYVTKDVEVGGYQIKAGETVMVGTGSANHDPRKFDRAEEMVFDRAPNNHLGFGLGPHRCAGSHIAKVEMRVALQEFLKRYPTFEIADHDGIRLSGGEIRTLSALPLKVG